MNCHSWTFSDNFGSLTYGITCEIILKTSSFLSFQSAQRFKWFLRWRMSLQHEPEQVANSGLGSSEETSRLLVDSQSGNNNNSLNANANLPKLQKAHSCSSYSCSTNGPTTSSGLVTQQSLSGGSSKPVLIRQDRTSTYLASPQLSALGTSEETSDDDNAKTISYQLMPNIPANRCRTCRSYERSSPSSAVYLPRSLSKESIVRLNPDTAVHHHSANIPPVYITGSPTNTSRIIRQSSQPEASTLSCCSANNCSHAHQTSSLRQLKDPSEGISGIAVDALRVRNSGQWQVTKTLTIKFCPYRLMDQPWGLLNK